MTCRGDKHDLRFVYQLDDWVRKDIVYADDGQPTVTEYRTAVFECRLCLKKIYGPEDVTTCRPQPSYITYVKGAPQYHWDV